MTTERPLVITEIDGKTELLSPDSVNVLEGRAVDYWLEVLSNDDDPDTRVEVAKAIPSHDTPRAREVLDELIEDDDDGVKLQANASKELLK